jgi:hypothetical protein
MSEQSTSDIVTRMVQPTGAAPCAGCGAIVETATVLGRTVYACDACANVRCSWCGKSRKPSAYAGDCEFPGLVDICQWCRGVETRRNGAKSHRNGPPRADDDAGAVETPPGNAGRLNRLELDP